MLHCRERLLDSIEALSRNAHDSALLLVGEVGSGKSSLLAHAHDRDPDGTSLVRINPSEHGWKLSGVSAILAALGDSRASEFTGRFALRSEEPGELAMAAAELLTILRGLDLVRVLLLVDDIDRMDAASRWIVGHMAGHLPGSGMRIVATAVELSRDEPLAGIPSLRIAPLDGPGARELAPAWIDPGTLRILSHSAGGNLGAFDGFLTSLTTSQLHGKDALRLPAGPAPAGWAKLARVGRTLGSQEVAMLVRLGTGSLHLRTSLTHWAPDAEDSLQELLDSGMVREAGPFVMLTDTLLRSALAVALPSHARRELHAELAATSGALLHPWHASWADPSSDLREPLMESAAELARLGFTFAAVEMGDRATRLGRDRLAGPLAGLADRLLVAGEPALADRYLTLAAGDRLGAPEDRVRIATVRLRVDGMAGRDTDLATEAVDGVAAETLRGWSTTRAAVAAVRGHLPPGGAGALELDDEETDPVQLAFHARARILMQEYPHARVLIGRLSRSVARPNRMWAAWMTALAVDCDVRAGRMGQAFELSRDWDVRHHGAAGPEGFIPIEVWARLGDGEFAAAQERLAEWTSNAPTRAGPLAASTGLALQGELAAVAGDPDRACELLLLADSVATSIGDPALPRHLPGLTEALMGVGRVRAAQAIAQRLTEAASIHPSRWAQLASSRATATSAPLDAARELFEATIAMHRPDDSVFERGKLYLAYSRRLAAAGATADAERAAADARIAFAGCGANAWIPLVAEVQPNPDPTSTSTSTPRSLRMLLALTAEERTVAELVARGLRNKEIASQLFVSLRTVELRLTHIYRKVGARSRAHLVAMLS